MVAINTLNRRFENDIKVENVINMFKTFKTQMLIALDVLKESDFSWNDIEKAIKVKVKVWNEAV